MGEAPWHKDLSNSLDSLWLYLLALGGVGLAVGYGVMPVQVSEPWSPYVPLAIVVSFILVAFSIVGAARTAHRHWAERRRSRPAPLAVPPKPAQLVDDLLEDLNDAEVELLRSVFQSRSRRLDPNDHMVRVLRNRHLIEPVQGAGFERLYSESGASTEYRLTTDALEAIRSRRR